MCRANEKEIDALVPSSQSHVSQTIHTVDASLIKVIFNII